MGSNSEPCMSQPSPEIVYNANESLPAMACSRPVSPSVAVEPPPARALCSKVLKGQFISGEHAVYDIDKQVSRDTLQHLDVLPISVYGWDLVLVTGRQVAVNRKYICYCLRPGSIRILSRNVASRGLFQGHSQRVTDMSFFAENEHLVASVSLDGRLLVWKILEDHNADDKFQLSGQILLGIQFDGEWKDVHPRVCWHPQAQDYLVMCINKYVLKIDLNEARTKGSSVKFMEETFLKCDISDLIAGVQLIGLHDDLVTDLSICSRNILCIASASKDGTVRIWDGGKMSLLSVLIPHQGQPVGSSAFISVPNRSDEAVLLTGGHLNHNLKLWVPANATGSLDGSIWRSVQTLELKSSAEVNMEQAFFNQVCVVPQAGIVLIGNTKKHAIYSIHLDFGSAALATRMDYLVEVSIAMPILSLTAMVDVVINHQDIIQVFCVQTRAIQQYSFDVSLCIPTQEHKSSVSPCVPLSGALDPLKMSVPKVVKEGGGNLETEVIEKSAEEKVKPFAGNLNFACEHNLVADSGSGFGSWVEVPNWVAATLKKTLKNGSMKDATDVKETTLTSSLSPLSPVLKSRTVSGSEAHVEGSPSSFPSSTDCNESSEKCRLANVRPQFSPTLTLLPEEEDKCKVTEGPPIPMGVVTSPSETSSQLDSQTVPTRSCTITPSKLMAMACFEAAAVVASKLSRNARHEEVSIDPEVESELDVGKHETHVTKGAELNEQECNAAKLVGFFEHDKCRSCFPLEKSEQLENNNLGASNKCKIQTKGASIDISENPSGVATRSYNAKKKKSKNKTRDNDTRAQTVHGCIPMQMPVFGDTSQVLEDSEDGILKSVTFPEIAFEDLAGQVLAMQQSFVELLAFQEDMQNHVAMAIATSLSTETMHMHSAFEQSLDNSFKSCMDSLWSAIDKAKGAAENLQEECFQQLTRAASSFVDQEEALACNRVFKTEVKSIGSKMGQLASSNIDTAIATAMSHNLEGFHDKIIKQVEKSLSTTLDSSIPWQCHRHFTTSGKHLLQDDLYSCFQEQAFPKFHCLCEDMMQKSCEVLYEEISQHAVVEGQQLGSMCLALSSAIEEKLVSSSSAVSSLKEELLNTEKRIQSRAEHASVNYDLVTYNCMQNSADFQSKMLSLQHSEMSYDFAARLRSWMKEGQYEEAFNHALSSGNVTGVFWLCKQVDPMSLFAAMPPPLSQGVLLSLVQHLGYDLGNDSFQKLTWIQEASLALNPNDHVMGSYMRPFLDQLYQNLQRHILLFSTDPKLSNQARVVMHIVNSLLTACK